MAYSIATIENVLNVALPCLSGCNVTYIKEHNIFLSDGYTSAAGNTYYQGVRLSDRILVKYSLGQGYCHRFLNGIQVYGFDGKQAKLIGCRDFYNCIFSESYAKQVAIGIVRDFVESQAVANGIRIETKAADDFATKMVEDVLRGPKLIA